MLNKRLLLLSLSLIIFELDLNSTKTSQYAAKPHLQRFGAPRPHDGPDLVEAGGEQRSLLLTQGVGGQLQQGEAGRGVQVGGQRGHQVVGGQDRLDTREG